ncbi:transposase, partial [Candidatus Peregrinibacteria bacterium]|nr:transposase [Candidatus Peregrinibacteria bacterium]
PVIIGSYKSAVTKTANSMQNGLFFQWQRSYYDHIVRDDESLHAIRRYIHNNPTKWDTDRNRPADLWM